MHKVSSTAPISGKQPATETRTTRSFCRVCTSLCGIQVEVAGDEVARIRGDRDHPVSRGYTCPKGRALVQLHHHEHRLECAQVRSNGRLQSSSWDHCLDDLGAKLRRIIETHGPAAVGIYFGSGVGMDAAGYRMSEALHAAIGTPAKFSPLTIDGTAKVLVASLMGGFPGLNARPDYDDAALVIYVGVNPVVSHGHATAMPIPPSTAIKAVTQRGETWVIDPRRCETAKFTTRHMAPHPGKDYAILAYLVRELLHDGANRTILAGYSVDSDRLQHAVRPFERAYAAQVAGVLPAELDALLTSVRRAGRVAVDTGTGVTMSAEANVTQWMAWALMILTDSMNRQGGVWFHPGFFRRLDVDPLPIMPPEALFASGPASRTELHGFLGEWPCAALPDEINDGNIRALLNLGGNLVTAFPDENALRPALQKLEVFATLDIVANETTALSTHVLPCKDQLERPDVTFWDFLSSRVSAQYTPAVVAPVGERHSSWWILAQLLHRLGHALPDGLPADDLEAGADDAVVASVATGGRVDFEAWKADGYVQTDRELPAEWVDRHIDRLGGWRLAPQMLVEQLTDLVKATENRVEPLQSLRLIPRRQRRHVNAQFLFLGDNAEVLLNPGDAAAAGIVDGQSVIIRSARGEMTGTARLSDAVRQGVVSVPHGHEDANVNLLTDTSKADRLTGMAWYSGFPVSIHPAPAP